MYASVVVGQANFTSGDVNQGLENSNPRANTIRNAFGIYTDGNKLFIADGNNYRVLIFNSIPSTNNASADVVIGQPNFTTNTTGTTATTFNSGVRGVITYGPKLIITEQTNNRILIYNTIPTTNGVAADVVVGQTDFTSKVSSPVSASSLSAPRFSSVCNGKLVVSDTGNNRVLIWNSIPTTNSAPANVVVGQTDFSSTSTGVTASTLNGPRAFCNEQKLYVADLSNHRVLIYNSIPTTNGASADVVIGQSDFTSNSSGTSASKFNQPVTPFADGQRLYIPDASNNRVLIYNSIPTANGASADIVIGQPNFSSSSANQGSIGQNTLNGPIQVFTAGNKLFIADGTNNRFLIFDNLVDTPKPIFTSSPYQIDKETIRFESEVSLSGGTHSIWKIEASVNGGPFGEVTSLWDTVRTNPGIPDDKIAKFYHDIKPDNLSDYIVTFKAFSTNADTTSFTYFTPFLLDSVSPIKFSVNKTYLNLLKDQLDHYEVWIKQYIWTKHIDQIPISYDLARDKEDNLLKILDNTLPEGGNGIYENGNLKATYTNDSATIEVSSKLTSLSPGKYEIKVLAVDKSGHSQETLPQELIIGKPYPYSVNPKKPRVQAVSVVASPSPLRSIIYDLESPQAGPMPSASPIQRSETGRLGIFNWIVNFLEALFH